MSASDAIDEVIRKARADGNAVVEVSTGWTEVDEVFHMRTPLSESLRSELKTDPRLRVWVTERTPHNRAEEGFTDDLARRAISFPG